MVGGEKGGACVVAGAEVGGCALCRARARPGLAGWGLSMGCRGGGWRRGSGRCGARGWWGFGLEGRCWWT